nr:hypothetical protein [Mycobacteroides abscessus]
MPIIQTGRRGSRHDRDADKLAIVDPRDADRKLVDLEPSVVAVVLGHKLARLSQRDRHDFQRYLWS